MPGGAHGGQVLFRAQTANVATAYLALNHTGKGRFFDILANEFGVERAGVGRAIADDQGADVEPAKLMAERQLRRALPDVGINCLVARENHRVRGGT